MRAGIAHGLRTVRLHIGDCHVRALIDDDDIITRITILRFVITHWQTQHPSHYGKQSATDCSTIPTSKPSMGIPEKHHLKHHFLCVCRWSAQDDDSMARISLHNPYTHPYTHYRTISFALSVCLKQGSTSACHVVALCASAHRMSTAAQGQSAHLRVREEHIKLQTNHVVCDQIHQGVPDVEASGPSSSEDESLKLKPLAHMRKQRCCGEAHGSQIATGRCCKADCISYDKFLSHRLHMHQSEMQSGKYLKKCAHSLCESQVLLE